MIIFILVDSPAVKNFSSTSVNPGISQDSLLQNLSTSRSSFLITPNDNLPNFLTCLLYSFSSIIS